MRLIDADALLEKSWDADTRIGYVQVVDVGDIEEAPTLDAVIVKHGRWEWFCNEPLDFNGYTYYSYGYRCTACRDGGTCWIRENKLSESEELFFKNEEFIEDKYCSACGAKMDLKE